MLSRYILDLEAALWRVQPAPQADWCFWRESQRCGENIQVRMALASDAWSYFNDLRREKLAGVLQLQRVTALWLSSCDKCRREHSGAGRGGVAEVGAHVVVFAQAHLLAGYDEPMS